MKRIESFLSRLLTYGTLLASYGLVGTVLLQIFARFFLPQAPCLDRGSLPPVFSSMLSLLRPDWL